MGRPDRVRWLEAAGMDRLALMRMRGWVIDLFLWACPLGGGAIFILRLLAAQTTRSSFAIPKNEKLFHVPGAGGLTLLAVAILLPLLMSFVTRRVVGFFAGASFLVLLVTCTSWWRSHSAGDQISLYTLDEGAYHSWVIGSGRGGVAFIRRRNSAELRREAAPGKRTTTARERRVTHWWYSPPGPDPASWDLFETTPRPLRRLGFAGTRRTPATWSPRDGGITSALAVPYWFCCLLATPLPLAWTVRYRRRRRIVRRALAGQCVGCGYDLRATPDPTGARLAVCPECGEARR